MVRALLCESRIEVLRLRARQALNAAVSALKYMGDLSESQKLNTPLGDNDDTERFSLGPGLWLQARLQVKGNTRTSLAHCHHTCALICLQITTVHARRMKHYAALHAHYAHEQSNV